MANQTSKGKRSYQPLIWIALYLVNVMLIIFVQATFLYPYERPITKESLGNLPYFADCEVLDMIGEGDHSGPGYVLYADENGNEQLVELDFMLFIDKFAIDENSMQQISGTEYQEIEFKRLTGSNTIAVENHQISNLFGWGSDGGLEIKHYIGLGLVLLLMEGGALWAYETIKKKQ